MVKTGTLFILSSLWLFTLMLPVTLYGAVGDVIDSIDAEVSSPGGLEFDGGYLWNIVRDYNGILRLDTSGNVIGGIYLEGYYISAVAYDGSYFWIANDLANKISKIDSGGNLISTHNSPAGDPTGLAFDGAYLWVTDSGSDKLYKMDTSDMSIAKSFSLPVSNSSDLTYDGTYFWITDDVDNKIYKVRNQGNLFLDVIDSFDSPGSSPSGVTFEGTYLWIADSNDNKIYKTDIGYAETGGNSRLIIFPPSNTVMIQSQEFDFVVSVELDSFVTLEELTAVSIDGVSRTDVFSRCAIVGSLTDSNGVTYRCPNLNAGIFSPGYHVISVEARLSNGVTLTKSVSLEIISNSE